MVGFFKRLFPQKSKSEPAPPMNISQAALQTDDEQAAVRTKMEGEMATEKDRRDSAPKPE